MTRLVIFIKIISFTIFQKLIFSMTLNFALKQNFRKIRRGNTRQGLNH